MDPRETVEKGRRVDDVNNPSTFSRGLAREAAKAGVTVTVYLTPCQRPSEGRWDTGNAIDPLLEKGLSKLSP
jgi:hypothetical protein